MWTRAELKDRAKYTFKMNYWRCVLISLILALAAGGISGGSGAVSSVLNSTVSDGLNGQGSYASGYGDEYYGAYGTYDGDTLDGIISAVESDLSNDTGMSLTSLVLIFVSVFMTILLIALTVSVVTDVFVLNPLSVGCRRFYVRNLHEKAQVGNIGFAFDTNYMNVVKITFFKDLYTILWSLLFVIPGIIKSYEYMMIPYILSENPGIPKEEAFEISRRMMDGQKWNAFVLDLSFIGWHILGAMTCGILEVFYVTPYSDATHAALYEALKFNGGGYGNRTNTYDGNMAG